MPLYEYKCLDCGRRAERIEKVSGPHLKKCPHCGGNVEPVITAPAIQFKGQGWYVTDYAGKSTDGESKEQTPATETKESKEPKETKETAGKKKDSGAKETVSQESKEKKPAKKK